MATRGALTRYAPPRVSGTNVNFFLPGAAWQRDNAGRTPRKLAPPGATSFPPRRLSSVNTLDTDAYPPGRAQGASDDDARSGVTALYQAHAVSMIRIALIMLGERAAAEDVVQDAFFGLYRRWDTLDDQANALTYVRSAVLNGCRDTHRRQTRGDRRDRAAARSWQELPSAETTALISEDHRRILAAVRRLPGRRREAMVCRF